MRTIDTSEMTFLHPNVFGYGNANGGVVAVRLTVWQDKNGAIHYVANDPAEQPILEKLLRREVPDV